MGIPTSSQVALDRAHQCYRAITGRGLYDCRRGLFGRRRWPLRRSYEALWPFANAWSALCTYAAVAPATGVDAALSAVWRGAAAYLPGGGATRRGATGYASTVGPPLGVFGDTYYDDNAWLGLAMLQHAEVPGAAGAAAAVERSAGVLDFVRTGWSVEPRWAHPGGVRWKVPAASRSRNTCATAPAAQLAVLHHRRTGDQGTLAWALAAYHWVRAALLGPDGLYLDRIDPDGRVAADRWSYNQGTMVGAGVLLHGITGDEAYLEQAGATAAAALDALPVARLVRPNGPAFNAVFFRNVLLLDRVAPDPRYRQLATDYGDAMWEARRDPHTGYFVGPRSPLNATAPMLQIYALLAGAPPRP